MVPVVNPFFDDDIQMSQVWSNQEFAVQARDAWRSRGYRVGIYDREGAGPLFEKDPSSETVSVERGMQAVRIQTVV